jgi:hypothetical protein
VYKFGGSNYFNFLKSAFVSKQKKRSFTYNTFDKAQCMPQKPRSGIKTTALKEHLAFSKIAE